MRNFFLDKSSSMDNKKLVDEILRNFKGDSLNALDTHISSVLRDLYKVKELVQVIRVDTEDSSDPNLNRKMRKHYHH